MKIELISHASILITCGDIQILTDPWYTSRSFNNSWGLLGAKDLLEEELKGINYIWISHEHPDHFNAPTLKAFPDWFKKQVTILFQAKNSDQLFETMKDWGFEKFRSLPNQTMITLAPETQIYCYPTHLGDSCLGVRHNGQNLFNINDAELSEDDSNTVLKEFGDVDVIANQFSLDSYLGFANYQDILPKMAKDKLERLANNHKHLRANLTIPFASFIYFATIDNKFMNQYANTPEMVTQYMEQKNLKTHFMEPGEVFDIENKEFHDRGLSYWQESFSNIDNLNFTESEVVDYERIETAALEFNDKLYKYYPRPLIWMIRPLKIYIPDLKILVRYAPKNRLFHLIEADTTDAEADIIVYSQPLWYGFKFTWGFETLAISSRILVKKNYLMWKLIKNLSILMNQEVYLKPKYLTEKETRGYIRESFSNGLASQILLKSMSNLKYSR